MPGLRYEVWTLPWSATFQRVIADLPVIVKKGRGTIRASDFGAGSAFIPSDYDRLDEVISTTVGSLMRVYDEDNIGHEWLIQRVDHTLSETGMAKLSGEGIESAFDQVLTYPYDYEGSPTTFPNHVYGGPEVLDNPGFETQATDSAIYDVDVGAASGGTFLLQIGADPTGTIAFNADDTTVNNALETGITELIDVFVTGTGSTGPWRVEMVDPKVPSDVLTGDGSLLTPSDTLTITTVRIGSAEISQAWTKSQRADSRSTLALHGTYSVFRQSSGAEPVRTGSFSQVVIGTQYAGLQQIVQVEPGGTYQASIFIRTNAASQTFRLVIRDRNEGFIASTEITPAANTFTQASITDVIIPAGVDEIVFRAANITPSATGTTFYDDASFTEGLAAANIGVIATALMNDAITDHAADTRGVILDWVQITSWDSTNDSSTTAWADTESFTAFRGASMGQTFDRIRDMNYEWRLVPVTPAAPITHALEIYQSGNMGTDHSVLTAANTPALVYGMGVTKGKIVQRIPRYTAVLVEGAEGAYVEAKDATAETNFGRLEKYHGDVGLTSGTSLTAAAQHLLDKEAGSRTSIQVTVLADDAYPRPLVHYTVGDTVNTTLLPIVTRTGKRVEQITYQNSEPPEYQITLVAP